jgi:general secretion pathway protein G
MKRTLRRRPNGFTLLEIMLVVGIIAILMSSAAFFMTGSTDTAQAIRVDADIKTYTTQLRTYEILNLSLPTTQQGLQALVVRPTSPPIPKRWRRLFEELPADPWGQPYNYEYPGRRSGKSFDLFSSGPDTKPGTDDDIGNWTPAPTSGS